METFSSSRFKSEKCLISVNDNENKVNGIFYNSDGSLITVATDNGYKIFESYNFIPVSESDEFQDFIGALKIAVPFYESNLILFVGKDSSSTFPSNHLVIWDDSKKIKIGVIILKEKILDAKITKQGIFILVSDNILIFDMKDLKHIYTIQDVNHIKTGKIYLGQATNPLVLVNIPMTRPNQLKVNKCSIIFNL